MRTIGHQRTKPFLQLNATNFANVLGDLIIERMWVGIAKVGSDFLCQLTEQISQVREALKRSVDFLRTELHVMSDDFLPYERQLVALAHVHTMRATLSAGDAQILRKWFWRTSFSERYRRGGEGDGRARRVPRALPAPELSNGPAATGSLRVEPGRPAPSVRPTQPGGRARSGTSRPRTGP